MVFSSIPFLYYFLPITLIVYFVMPKKFKNLVLLISSIVFYAWGEPRYALIMICSIILGYVFGLLLEKFQNQKISKLLLGISIILNVGILCYFKYANFFIINFAKVTGIPIELLSISLPLGISFYTFQILSYTVDVYRGAVKAQKNPINLGAYIAMFPQLIAGPIVRYSDIESQLTDRSSSIEKISEGIKRFIIGLSKKVLIANNIGLFVEAFKDSNDKSTFYFWIYAIAFVLQIYFDFSGYSDMAIGLGKILGFDFMENFNYPYTSKSATEFWRRWHISLGTWFRDYVYIPLGGNRVSIPRHILNILIVWMLTGFWHGAEWNFIIFGLLFAAVLILEKYVILKYLEKGKVWPHIYLLLVILFAFSIFNANGITDCVTNITGLFGYANGTILPFFSAEAIYYTKSYLLLFVIAAIGSTPLPKKLYSKVPEKILTVFEPIALCALLIICTAFIVDGSFNPFLYFRF